MRFFRLVAAVLLTTVSLDVFAQSHIPGQIIVQIEKEASIENILKYTGYANAEAQLLSSGWNIWLLKFETGDDELLNVIRKNPAVRLAQFNHRVAKRSFVPNDTLFTQQWNLQNTGQSGGAPGADIKATSAWDFGSGDITAAGDTIVIAVVDEGFYLPHEDLRFWKNRHDPRNGIDDDLNGYIDDYNGWNVQTKTDSILNDSHGTHVAGIAAAAGNNLVGTVGVAYDARLMPVSIPNYEEAQVVQAYSYIFDMRKLYNDSQGQNGAFIVAANSSFGWDFGKPDEFPLWCAMYDSLGSLGIISVGSTMNIATDVDIAGDIPSTCASDHLIIATNTNRFDRRNNGAAIGYHSVDLGVPGTAIQSTIPFNKYGFQSGTSMSAAHVAGAVALMYSAVCPDFIQAHHDNPAATALLVKNYILNGADILSDLDGLTVSGGRLNLYNSIHSFYNDYCVSCLEVAESLSFVSCHGDTDGSITLSVSEGTPPYVLEWSTGEVDDSITGLSRGKYSVRISDNNGCEKYRYYEITQPFPIVVNLIADSAVNGANGAVASFVTGGTPPYAYLWSDANNSISENLPDLPPGEYSVTVTDANGCQSEKSARVGNIVGIDFNDNFSNELKIYPNPVEALASIKIGNGQPVSAQLHVSDVSGKILLRENFSSGMTLDFSEFSSGVYIVKIFSHKFSVVRKIAKF